MHWLALALVLLLQSENAGANGVVEIFLHKFRNLDGKLQNGKDLCDMMRECDTYFEITPYLAKKPLRTATTLIFENRNDVEFPIISNGLPKSYRFAFLPPYKGEINVKVRALDEDVFDDSDLICSFDFTFWDLEKGKLFNSTLFGCSRNKFLKLSIRVSCSEFYFGKECTTFCKPNATGYYDCDPVTGVKKCIAGYQGPNCRDKINPTPKPCSGQPCQNGGKCLVVGSTSYKCNCSSQYTGKHCETEIKPKNKACDSRPCKNGGKCLAVGSELYQCSCSFRYTGPNCETEMDPCYAHRNLSAEGRTPSDFIDPQGPFRNDHHLKEEWYRVIGARSGVLSSRCSALYTCGTKYPIHLLTEVDLKENETIKARVCVSSCVDCCHMRMDILVKSCKINSNEFFVYKLRPPLSIEMGYCVE